MQQEDEKFCEIIRELQEVITMNQDPSGMLAEFSLELRRFRVRREYTRPEMATQLGCSVQTLYRWEQPKLSGAPQIDNLVRLLRLIEDPPSAARIPRPVTIISLDQPDQAIELRHGLLLTLSFAEGVIKMGTQDLVDLEKSAAIEVLNESTQSCIFIVR